MQLFVIFYSAFEIMIFNIVKSTAYTAAIEIGRGILFEALNLFTISGRIQ